MSDNCSVVSNGHLEVTPQCQVSRWHSGGSWQRIPSSHCSYRKCLTQIDPIRCLRNARFEMLEAVICYLYLFSARIRHVNGTRSVCQGGVDHRHFTCSMKPSWSQRCHPVTRITVPVRSLREIQRDRTRVHSINLITYRRNKGFSQNVGLSRTSRVNITAADLGRRVGSWSEFWLRFLSGRTCVSGRRISFGEVCTGDKYAIIRAQRPPRPAL